MTSHFKETDALERVKEKEVGYSEGLTLNVAVLTRGWIGCDVKVLVMIG